MKSTLYLLLLPLFNLLVFACNPSTESTTSEADTTTMETENPVEQKWDEMMVIHDAIMPETSKLVRQQKALQEVPNAEQTIQALADAEEAMWDWMNNLKQKSKILEMDKAEAMDYLDQELVAIKDVQQQMTSSLAAAEELLEEAN